MVVSISPTKKSTFSGGSELGQVLTLVGQQKLKAGAISAFFRASRPGVLAWVGFGLGPNIYIYIYIYMYIYVCVHVIDFFGGAGSLV